MLRERPLCLLGLTVLFGCTETDRKANAAKKQGRPALVHVAQVRSGSIDDRWRFLGDARAASRSDLAAGASGAVTRVLAREGDPVERGQLLVEVDSALALAKLRVAQATEAQVSETVAQAKREHERLGSLEKQVVAEVELERAQSKVLELESHLRSAEAATQQARAELNLHRVKAPFRGVVATRQVDVGDWVRPGDPVLELVSLEEIEVLVDGSPDLFRHAKRKGEATLVSANREPLVIAGVVPALNPSTRTIRIRLVPKQPIQWLLPGMPVNVEFAIDLSGQGVVIPEDALLAGATQTKVVKINANKAQHLVVEVLAKANQDALVSSAELKLGDQVVVRGNERLRPGQEVKVVRTPAD